MKYFKKAATAFLAAAIALVSVLSVNPITAEAAGGVVINSVTIQGTNVVVSATGAAGSEDGLYHLVASAGCETAPAGVEVAQSASPASFTAPLNLGQPNSLIYKKFTVCVKAGGKLTPVSNSMYILNPEACATARPARMDNGIKGLFVEFDSAIEAQGHATDLGIKQININVPISKIRVISVYDHIVQKYNAMGIQVNMILLADKAAGPEYISPLSYKGATSKSEFFAFNASTPEGLEKVGNAAALIASRYSNIGYGQVDNFIIGNEVNGWRQWNYLKFSQNQEFVNEYYNAFRVMYNGIKAANANANVYTCIDHQWAKPEASYFMAGKEFLTRLNSAVSAEGNIDWKVAVHPNNYWLLAPKAWETNNKVTRDQSSAYVTMANFEILTDFLSLPEMLNPQGQVRSVKISELGYVSNKGEDLQAASIAFAFMVASQNSHVDGVIILREADNAYEIKQGIKCGICNVNGSPKMGYNFLKNPTDPSIIAQANQIAGMNLQSLISPR